MLKVIYGKEEALRQELLRLARRASEEGKRLEAVVPEMATLHTEETLLTGLGAVGSFDLEVLSPSRLSERVFEREGQGAAAGKIRIDDQGKRMAVAGAMKRVEKELSYYRSSLSRQGFIAECATLIADLKRAGLTPGSFREHVETLPEGASRDKMSDIGKIYEAYEEELAGRFVDGEDVNEEMLRAIAGGSCFRDTLIAAAGFDVITGTFARTLIALHRAAGNAEVLLRSFGGGQTFPPVRDSVKRLRDMCIAEGIPFSREALPDPEEKLPPDIAFLRDRFPLDEPGTFAGMPSAVRMVTGATAYFEARYAAREIRRLHDREGVSYGEMGVILCDFENDAGTVEAVMKEYDIPCYVPRTMPAASHGAARFVLSCLRCAAERYRKEDLAALARSGWAPLTDMEAWRLENYIMDYNINGSLFLKPFDRGKDEEEKAWLEEPRQRLSGLLEGLRKGIRESRNNREAMTALYRCVEEAGIYDRLMAHEEMLMERGLAAEAGQGRQMWRELMHLMDETVEIYGDEPTDARTLARQLEAGLNACELRSLPPDGDSVMCFAVGGLAGRGLKAAFILGLNDGTLQGGDPGIFTDEEISRLQEERRVHIALNADGRDDLKRLDLYNALCASDERLVITRAAATQAGDAKRPHLYWSRIRRLMPLLTDVGSTVASEIPRDALGPLSPASAASELAVLFGRGEKPDENWRDAWRYLCREDKDTAREIIGAFRRREDIPALNRDVTGRLFLENIVSVSRLESFAVCPYRHFVEYGLRPRRAGEWDATKMEAGSFYHSAIEGITRALSAVPGWPAISRKQADEVVAREAKRCFGEIFGARGEENQKIRAAGQKYLRVLKNTAWAFTRGAQVSSFSPVGGEIRFGYDSADSLPAVELRLEDGRRVLLHGVIDRIDRYEGDEGIYFRVIDYKSGAKAMKPEEIFYGTQLQLLLYLKAAAGGEKGAEPAGAYYMVLKDPILKVADPEDRAMVETALAKELHLSGVSLRDVKILEKMDSADPPVTMDSLVKKNGDFAENKPLASLEEMRLLIGHAMEKARQLCLKIQDGHIGAEPMTIRGERRTPCDSCDFADICRRENRRPRSGKKMKFAELYDILRQEEEKENPVRG